MDWTRRPRELACSLSKFTVFEFVFSHCQRQRFQDFILQSHPVKASNDNNTSKHIPTNIFKMYDKSYKAAFFALLRGSKEHVENMIQYEKLHTLKGSLQNNILPITFLLSFMNFSNVSDTFRKPFSMLIRQTVDKDFAVSNLNCIPIAFLHIVQSTECFFIYHSSSKKKISVEVRKTFRIMVLLLNCYNHTVRLYKLFNENFIFDVRIKFINMNFGQLSSTELGTDTKKMEFILQQTFPNVHILLLSCILFQIS